MKDVKALVFDFGGTLDTDGIHWHTMWKTAYAACGLQIESELFDAAYFEAERILNESEPISLNYKELLSFKAAAQFRHIYSEKFDLFEEYRDRAELVALYCYEYAVGVSQVARDVLEKLKKRYALAAVSNFYGNLRIVLNELRLLELMEVVIDSKIEKVRKPDKQIFLLAAEKLHCNPGECAVIGDSYVQDIVPAKQAGFHTIMLSKDNNPTFSFDSADVVIGSVAQLTEYL
ncbi:MAG: HAD family hydrolase [Chloroflexota bacterium]